MTVKGLWQMMHFYTGYPWMITRYWDSKIQGGLKLLLRQQV